MDEVPWPFLGSEALAAKAIPERAMRSLYEAVYPDVYVPSGIELTACQRAKAAWLWSRRRGVVAGQSAAALLGTRWVEPLQPAQLIYNNRRPPPLLAVHTDTLLAGETVQVDGITVTSAARTAFDLGRRTPLPKAIQQLDALAHVTDVKAVDIEALIAQHRGERGLAGLRRVLPLVDGGAESPQESTTRLVLIQAGFPIPQTQISVFNEYGDLLARIDMGWEQWRVGVEYDGAQHWTDPEQRERDIDRLVQLEAEGWIIIRVSSDLLRYRRGTLIARVGEALRSRM
ncbi:MAG: endonuclease domain-containing protein [Mycobacterium sp.]